MYVLLLLCSLKLFNFALPNTAVLRAEEAASEAASTVADGIVMEGLTAEDEKALSENKESFVFQAEVNRLMDIIINSLCK
jgi:hypothetical protein